MVYHCSSEFAPVGLIRIKFMYAGHKRREQYRAGDSRHGFNDFRGIMPGHWPLQLFIVQVV